MHALVIDLPTLAPQHHPDPLVAKAWPIQRDLPDPRPQRILIFGLALPIPGRP